MIKLLVSDLDGTLLKIGNEMSKGISVENKKAVLGLKKQGIDFAIASARGASYASEIEKKLGMPIYFVGLNGVRIKTLSEVYHNQEIENTMLIRLLRVMKRFQYEYNVNVCDTNENHYTLSLENYPYRNRKEKSNRNTLSNDGKSDFSLISKDMRFLKMGVFIEAEHMDEVRRELIEQFPEMTIVASDIDLIDILPKGMGKGLGIKQLAMKMGISLEEVAVVGDGENDIDMFKVAKRAYVIDHANPYTKKYATHTVKSVAEAIEDILKYNKGEIE